jgi:hypothetical protein
MTGMKDGSAPSPLAGRGDADDDEADSTAPGTESKKTASQERPEQSAESPTDISGGSATLPWIYRREHARDGRDITKQLHLQHETAQRESEFKAELERAVGDQVYLADIREAALLVAMNRTDEVAEQLREWGYDPE